MMSKLIATSMILAGLALTTSAYGDVDDDATITVVDEGNNRDDSVKLIELPDHAPVTAAKSVSVTTPETAKTNLSRRAASSANRFPGTRTTTTLAAIGTGLCIN